MTDQFVPPNQRFATLDQYLVWLRKIEEPVDGAWYREVEPGVFELNVAKNLRLDEPRTESLRITRDELARKLGFAR